MPQFGSQLLNWTAAEDPFPSWGPTHFWQDITQTQLSCGDMSFQSSQSLCLHSSPSQSTEFSPALPCCCMQEPKIHWKCCLLWFPELVFFLLSSVCVVPSKTLGHVKMWCLQMSAGILKCNSSPMNSSWCLAVIIEETVMEGPNLASLPWG